MLRSSWRVIVQKHEFSHPFSYALRLIFKSKPQRPIHSKSIVVWRVCFGIWKEFIWLWSPRDYLLIDLKIDTIRKGNAQTIPGWPSEDGTFSKNNKNKPTFQLFKKYECRAMHLIKLYSFYWELIEVYHSMTL